MLELLQNGAKMSAQRSKINEGLTEMNKSMTTEVLADWTVDGPVLELEPNTINYLTISANIATWTVTLSEQGTAMIVMDKTGYDLSAPASGANVYKLTDKGTEDITGDLVLYTITLLNGKYIHSFAELVLI